MEYKKVVRAIMANRKLRLPQQLNAIKQNVSAGQYKLALKTNPLFNKFLHKTPYFSDIKQIYIKEPFSFTGDLKKEFKWLSDNLENYLEEINDFILLKNEFEGYILLCDYEKAANVVVKVEGLYGVTLWSIDANLILEEHLNGSEANWNKLSYYLGEIKNSIYEFIINSNSKRAEKKLEYESYINQFQNDIDNVHANDIIKDFFVFKNFNLANYEYRFDRLESVLYVANIFSVIDQYLILIDVILYNTALDDSNDRLFSPYIKKLINVVPNDHKILNLYNVTNRDNKFVKIENSKDIIQCSNYYYSGDFTKAFELSDAGIDLFPNNFEYYIIYSKSLLNQQLDFVPKKTSPLIVDVLRNTYNLLSFKNGAKDSFDNLLKTSLSHMNTSFGKQIYGLLSEIEGQTGIHFKLAILNAPTNSYKAPYFGENRPQIFKNFIEMSKEHSFKICSFKLNNEVELEADFTRSKAQELSLNATREYKKECFGEVVKILTETNVLDENSYYYERKNGLLFNSYLHLNLIREALLLFGTIQFNDKIITRKLSFFDLYEKIFDTKTKDEFIDLIELPILYSLLVKEYDLYEVYDDFMCSYDIFHIQELDVEDFINKFSLEKTIHFLSKVVTIDTIKYSTDYDSINDVEEDRVSVLNILIDINPTEKLNYQKEIDEIYRINAVRKVLKEVDEGRLFIDVDNLKELQIKKFKSEFQRFKEIEHSGSLQALIGFNPSNTKNWENILTEKNVTEDKYNSADYLAFKNIYLESRNNFLYSKEYGLDSSLSTRIRHGALKNHIRSVFEKLELVTSKSHGIYQDNELWKNQLLNYPELNIEVQNKLKDFSNEIDEYCVFIVEKMIQIQTEKNNDIEEGLFQYNTNDKILYAFYTDNKERLNSVEAIIDIILTDLVNYTILSLQKTIAKAFSEIIPKEFQDLIKNIILELRELNLPNECELIPNLTSSSTEIQKELEYLSEWFNLNTTNSSSLLSLETILNASIELTNKINPNYNLTPNIVIEQELLGYSSLIFVFNILLNNVIQHSKLDNDKIKLEITVAKDSTEEYSIIKFTNNLKLNVDYKSNKSKLERIKENWNDHSNIERSNKEGESGYDKIKRILLYEAHAKSDKFDFEINKKEISISLYFPYTEPSIDEEDTNN
jgi:hypothetical protein